MCAALHNAFLLALNSVVLTNQFLTQLYKDIPGVSVVEFSLQLNETSYRKL